MGVKGAWLGGGNSKRSDKARSKMMKVWILRASTTILLWTCVVQLTAIGETWGPRVLKGWPSCFTPSIPPFPVNSNADSTEGGGASFVAEKLVFPPKSEFFWNFFFL
jgi:hypothetical protein